MSLVAYRCLVIFHNGSDGMVDLLSCGIPQLELVGTTKVLWTSSGKISEGQKLRSGLFLYANSDATNWNALLVEEARETVLYTRKLGLGVTPEIATDCWLYYLSLSQQGGYIIYFNWAMHASSYWVCDGIVGCGQNNDQAWELANALQKHMRIEEYSSNTVRHFSSKLDISTKHWVCHTHSYFQEVPSGTTSLFFAPPHGSGYVSLPSKRFHEADQLRVLKLCRCTFSFSSPPFHCCRNLRFLGLDKCVDEQQLGEEEEKTCELAVETFKRLWVLDVGHTDWELDFPLETEEPIVSTNIREVHVNKGRIWRRNFAWRRLPNLHKLRVVEPTVSWSQEGREDEFKDMMKLDLLDLSGNNTIKVLPNLSSATNLKTLVLDRCVGLEHVGPQGLPPYLESFCFDSGPPGMGGKNKSKISRISLAGCARLADFRLHGVLPNLEELDLSRTAVKMVDIKDVDTRYSLKKVFLVGCKQLRSISWPYLLSSSSSLRMVCIDTRPGGEVARKPWWCDSLIVCQDQGEKEYYYCHAFVAVTDMRFLQSIKFLLVILFDSDSIWVRRWAWPSKVKVNLCLSSTSKDDGRSSHKKKMGGRKVAASSLPLPSSLTSYHDIDVSTEHQIITTQTDGSSSATTAPFEPLDFHMDIGEGVCDVPNNTASAPASRAIFYTMSKVKSLHVHDTSSITAVTREHIFQSPGNDWGVMNELKWCRLERCPGLQAAFTTQYEAVNFGNLETFWAARLLMARSIWHNSPRRSVSGKASRSFESLRAIHLHLCPRLIYVLEVSWNDDLSQLETLHILSCGDLRQVFLVEGRIQDQIAAPHKKSWQFRNGMLQFTKLKHLYLHELPSLQLICETKMYAPNLETICIRGCWSLRRLPATDARRRLPVAVDCEKDWWDKLEWDGMESGHHPSLFQPRHSKYYKKRHLRGTVLQ